MEAAGALVYWYLYNGRNGATGATGAAGVAGHHGDGDRLAGADHGRLQRDQAGHSIGLLAALADFAHQRQRNRSDLHALCELGLVCPDCVGGGIVQIV